MYAGGSWGRNAGAGMFKPCYECGITWTDCDIGSPVLRNYHSHWEPNFDFPCETGGGATDWSVNHLLKGLFTNKEDVGDTLRYHENGSLSNLRIIIIAVDLPPSYYRPVAPIGMVTCVVYFFRIIVAYQLLAKNMVL